jgi:hypothetical protein
MGMRVQLDPALDCNTRTVPTVSGPQDKPKQLAFLKMLCVALQDYGMIVSDGTADRNLLLELEDEITANWTLLLGPTYQYSSNYNFFIRNKNYTGDGVTRSWTDGIPWDRLRVVADPPAVIPSLPIGDTYVQGGGSAAVNFDSQTFIYVKASAWPDYLRYSYIKFNISNVVVSKLDNATVTLIPTVLGATGTVVEVRTTTTDNWLETTMDFNGRPASSATQLKQYTAVLNSPELIDVKAAVIAARNAGSNVLSLVISAITANVDVKFRVRTDSVIAEVPTLTCYMQIP